LEKSRFVVVPDDPDLIDFVRFSSTFLLKKTALLSPLHFHVFHSFAVAHSLSVADFLGLNVPVLDVRSPSEYAQGHIPSAVSFPLFSDAERAAVGTAYKQRSREAAFELGLEYVGPRMADFVRQARQLAAPSSGRLAVHCWRGGQRSGSMAWLLRSAGMDVVTLVGGYKSYRQHVLAGFGQSGLQWRVVGGPTGSGKTKVLRAMAQLGAQVIDLEGLARHKGSAFGSIGETEQPTVEQFENDLHAALRGLDPSRPVWLENESRSIGRVYLPPDFWAQKKQAPVVNIHIPHAARVANLLADYSPDDTDLLRAAFKKIEKKLGGQHLRTALEALDQGDLATAAEVALVYYDKTYQHCLDESEAADIRHVGFESGDPMVIARHLMSPPPPSSSS
jgi:tRNA 2-selenouridine synthase